MKLRRSIATFVSVATLVLGGFVGEAGAVQSESASGQISVVAHTSATRLTLSDRRSAQRHDVRLIDDLRRHREYDVTHALAEAPCTGSGSSSACNIAGSTYAATPTTTYSCPSGGSLSGSECYSSTSYDYGATESSSCGTGFAGGPDGCETSIPLAETFCTSPSTYSGGYCTTYYAPTVSYHVLTEVLSRDRCATARRHTTTAQLAQRRTRAPEATRSMEQHVLARVALRGNTRDHLLMLLGRNTRKRDMYHHNHLRRYLDTDLPEWTRTRWNELHRSN